jgi:hypothetical protein
MTTLKQSGVLSVRIYVKKSKDHGIRKCVLVVCCSISLEFVPEAKGITQRAAK